MLLKIVFAGCVLFSQLAVASQQSNRRTLDDILTRFAQHLRELPRSEPRLCGSLPSNQTLRALGVKIYLIEWYKFDPRSRQFAICGPIPPTTPQLENGHRRK